MKRDKFHYTTPQPKTPDADKIERKAKRAKYLASVPLDFNRTLKEYFYTVADFKKFLKQTFLNKKTQFITFPNISVSWRVKGVENRVELTQPEDVAQTIESTGIFTASWSQNYPINIYWNEHRYETPDEMQKRLDYIETLNKSDTREILAQRYYPSYDNDYYGDYRSYYWAGHNDPPYYLFQNEIVRAILDTREHVPNAKERKALRQAKAKFQRS